MHYYPPALDYAKWTLLFAGAACGFAMKSEPEGHQRGLLKMACFVLMTTGAVCGATAGILFNTRAPHYTATGAVAHIELHSGRGSHTDFDLVLPSGRISRLRFDSAMHELREGDVAEVSYQAQSLTVLNLSILDGGLAGARYHSSDNTFGSYLVLVVAAILLLYGVTDWLTDGTGASNDPKDNLPAPDGNVDTDSMLKL